MDEILNNEQIREQLSQFSGWKVSDKKIEKEFSFEDFRGSVDFVNRVANLAESANHHPEIEIDYDKVEIELSTHSAGGVTQKDIDLATEIEGVK